MRAWLFQKFFSDWVPFKWIDGHKTDIARVATFVFAVLVVATEYYPEFVPFIDQFSAVMATVLGLFGIEVGKQHKELKGK